MIDPRAVIDPAAELAADISVGPYSIIGPGVRIDSGTRIGPHVVISGPTRIGRDNVIYQFASLGDAPQDKKYAGESTRLEIGARNVIREYCTVNRGTVQGGGLTRVGDDNWIMAYVHIAHDCMVGNHTIFANAASLAGHVRVDDHAILGGFTLVHQFCRLGAYCFCAMGSAINKDVPPYVTVSGQRAKPHGINTEGLKRSAFSPQALSGLRKAYKLLYKSKLTLDQAIAQLETLTGECPEVNVMIDFLRDSTRSIVR